jgi:hypothetical protein
VTVHSGDLRLRPGPSRVAVLSARSPFEAYLAAPTAEPARFEAARESGTVAATGWRY